MDGIVLHQLLQWHNMLSDTERWPTTTLRNLEINVLADGLFHVATWVFVVVGLIFLWRAARASATGFAPRVLVGWILVGWGVFNLVEGIINHHILGIHNVRDDVATAWPWNVGFLIFGALLIIGGGLLTRSPGTTPRSSPVSLPRTTGPARGPSR